MIRPPSLKAGDRIAIVAPARKVKSSELEAAVKILKSWGLEVVLPPHLQDDVHGYLAARDANRLSDLQTCIDDPSISAIISARGGYGITRILDDVSLQSLKDNPKWLIGFSDITALHLKLFKEKIMSIHGTMALFFSRKEAEHSVDTLKKILFGNEVSIHAHNNSFNRIGNAEGLLIGGNLSLINDSLGTSSEVDTDGAILVLEEIDEFYYRLDRMLTQLKRAGKLRSLKGLVIGHMTDLKESELPFGEGIERIVMDKVGGYNYPVAFNFPSGHENPNEAWIVGETVSLKVDANGAQVSSKSNVS
jgi:muramoyltetrapeptide carboxypeptidase